MFWRYRECFKDMFEKKNLGGNLVSFLNIPVSFYKKSKKRKSFGLKNLKSFSLKIWENYVNSKYFE